MYDAGVRLLHGLLTRLLPVPTVPVDQLREGMLATVRGRVVPRDLMDSPLTGDRCVYYRYTVEQWRKSRVAGVGGDGFWELVERDEAILEFYLDDGTGRVIITPERARISPARAIEDTPFEITIRRRGQQLLIEPDDLLEVTGRVMLVDDLFDESRDYRGSSTRSMLRAPDGQELSIRLLAKAARES